MRHLTLPVLNDKFQSEPMQIPLPNSALDCIVVGHNDLDFDQYIKAQKAQSKISGAYFDAKVNSVRLHGKRVTYTNLLNHAMQQSTGRKSTLSAFEVPHLGGLHLTHHLRKRKFSVELINFFNKDKDRFARLLGMSPNAVAITSTYYIDPMPIIEVVRFIRKHSPRTRIIIGGPYIHNLCAGSDLAAQNYILQLIGADIYITDPQGLQSLTSAVTALRDPKNLSMDVIPNLVITTDNKNFLRTPKISEEYSINEGAIDWSHFKEDIFSLPIYMRTAMSCPFACSFCNFPAMSGEHKLADIEIIEREMQQLKAEGVRYLVFIDDTFNVPLPRFKRLLKMMIKNKFDFKWLSFFRCSNADDETFDLMAESGCIAVFLGIESGDQGILNNMKKFARTDKYIEGIAKLRERGIITNASFIVGFPGETQQTIENTIAFIQEAKPTFYNLQLYYHDTRTPVHEDADKYKIQNVGYSWTHMSMTWQEAAAAMEHIHKSITHSLPLTTYGFSIWSLPYLLSQGVTLDQFQRFAEIARGMLIRSLDDRDIDFNAELAALSAVFALGGALDADSAQVQSDSVDWTVAQ